MTRNHVWLDMDLNLNDGSCDAKRPEGAFSTLILWHGFPFSLTYSILYHFLILSHSSSNLNGFSSKNDSISLLNKKIIVCTHWHLLCACICVLLSQLSVEWNQLINKSFQIQNINVNWVAIFGQKIKWTLVLKFYILVQ